LRQVKSKSKSKPGGRRRIGRVTVYEHHGAWYTYHRHNGRAVRQRVGTSETQAECIASLLNAQLAASSARLPLSDLVAEIAPEAGAAFVGTPVDEVSHRTNVATLRTRFINHHEHVLDSSLSTVARYNSATQHLLDYVERQKLPSADDLCLTEFVQYLRATEVSPNGHANTARRKLRDKGIKYILETCRSMYRFGQRHDLVSTNPFSDFKVGKLRVRDAKPIFVFTAEQELALLRAADFWTFTLHVTLARTGIRPGELAHTLIEDVDWDGGWLHIRPKPELGWSIKAGRERRVPLLPELVALLRLVANGRPAGPLFMRVQVATQGDPALQGDRARLERVAEERLASARGDLGRQVDRKNHARILRTVWRDAGAVPVDRVRTSLMKIAAKAGLAVTTPKSWRHTFATLLQEANVDLLVRQETLGHKPTAPGTGVLGMTGVYTHTSPVLQRREIERAMRLRPKTLSLISDRYQATREEFTHAESPR